MNDIPDIIIRSPNLFKLKLGIGEDAYRTLSTWKTVSKYYDVGGAGMTGAAIAGSSVVANTFFAGKGFLALIGIGTAATPLGWLIAAGLASGAAYYGVSNILERRKDGMVQVVPTFINTPLDVLAVGISNLMFPLALQVALSDDDFSEDERIEIVEYFSNEWGYSHEYIDSRLSELESDSQDISIEELTDRFLRFIRENKDCNHKSIAREILTFLHDIAKSDGILTQQEKETLADIEKSINAQISPQISSKLTASLGLVREKAKEATSTAGQKIARSAAILKDATAGIKESVLPKPSPGLLKQKTSGSFLFPDKSTKAASASVPHDLETKKEKATKPDEE